MVLHLFSIHSTIVFVKANLDIHLVVVEADCSRHSLPVAVEVGCCSHMALPVEEEHCNHHLALQILEKDSHHRILVEDTAEANTVVVVEDHRSLGAVENRGSLDQDSKTSIVEIATWERLSVTSAWSATFEFQYQCVVGVVKMEDAGADAVQVRCKELGARICVGAVA